MPPALKRRADQVDGTTVAPTIDLATELSSRTRAAIAFGRASTLASALLGPDLRIEWATPAFAALVNRWPGDLAGRPAVDLLHPEDLAQLLNAWNEVGPGREGTVAVDIRMQAADGSWTIVEAAGEPLLDDPEVAGLLITVHPVGARRARQRALELLINGAPLDQILLAIVDLVACDLPDRIVAIVRDEPDAASPIVVAVPSPLSAEELDLVHRAWTYVRGTGDYLVRELPGDTSVWGYPIETDRGDVAAALVTVGQSGGPGPWLTGVIGRAVELAATAVARNRNDAELAHAATHDPLTGLLGLAGLLARLDEPVRRRGGQRWWALYSIGLDGFAELTERRGASFGDAVLVEIAARLQDSARASDVVARIGPDEFTVLCPTLPKAEIAATIAGRMAAEIARPMMIGDSELVVTASIGGALTPEGSDADGLLESAGRARKAAAGAGPGRWSIAG